MPHHPNHADQFPFTPVPRARHGKLTPERQRDFIAALARTGLVSEAALFIGVSVPALEKLRYAKGAESFRKAWDAARQCDAARAAREDTRKERHRGALHCHSPRPSRRTSHVAFVGPEPDPDDPLLGFRPYLHKAPRRNSITPDRQRGFIRVLAATGSVTQAARAIGASVEALYTLRARPGAEQFAKAWEHAIDLGIARLEDTALARALEGEERPIVSRGRILGHYRRHNDALVMFMLRHRRAGRYGSESERKLAAPQDEQAIIDSINRKLDLMRERLRGAGGADA